MEYAMEELVPIVAKLTEQYTSKESSSITYEAAHTLMEAVVYCIEECFEEKERTFLRGQLLKATECYAKGYDLVIQKVYQAKSQYENMIHEFQSYGCRNYEDTILKGIPQFFLWYDPKFAPQNHLLTLDYPILQGNPKKCGVDLILEYLNGAALEQKFLAYFEPQAVQSVLERVIPEYQTLYLDNICYEVLLMVIGCSIAKTNLAKLELTKEGCQSVLQYFAQDSVIMIQKKVEQILAYMLRNTELKEQVGYFQKMSEEFAVRIWYGIENHSLEQVFHVIE